MDYREDALLRGIYRLLRAICAHFRIHHEEPEIPALGLGLLTDYLTEYNRQAHSPDPEDND